MSTIVLPVGEIVNVDPPTDRHNFLTILSSIARTHNLRRPVWVIKKVRDGATWVYNSRMGKNSGKRNHRAEKGMDLGLVVHGPAIYLSPAECLAYQEEDGVQKSPEMDGMPRVRVSGITSLNVSLALQKKWGVIEHKSDHSWWILANYRSEAESYEKGSLLYTAP